MVHNSQQVGRLAMRAEGDNWNAYYALPGTMEGALPLGSIKLAFVQSEERKQIFMDLMREAVGDLIQAQVGVRPQWGGDQPAPEHERASRASAEIPGEDSAVAHAQPTRRPN